MYVPKAQQLLVPTFLLFGLVIISTGRELRVKINPGCILDGLNCTTWTNTSLIHIRSDGSNDSIHFIWSFNGSPSLLLARTLVDSTLNVNWEKYRKHKMNAISFEGPQPLYSFAYTLSKVWIFNDTDDNVRLDKVNQTDVTGYSTEYFAWERQDFSAIMNASEVELKFISNQYLNRSLGPTGFFNINVRAKESDGYSDFLPYMLHNSNMSQIDLDFSRVQMEYPKENRKHARVAFGFILTQGGNESGRWDGGKMRFDRVETLDDEHTPGVFSTINIRTPVYAEFDQGFLQWKPICYTQKVRDISNSIDVTSYEYGIQDYAINSTNPVINSSLLWAYYGSQLNSLQLQSTNISFGTKKDGFYNATPHISWTHMAGFGSPPEDYVSFLVILVISIGFGIPGLLIVLSSIFIIYKRMTRPRDEVLLGH